MARYNSSKILPTILVVLGIIIVAAGIVAVSRALFFSGSDKPEEVDTSEQSLIDTSADSSVRMSVRGPIVANENFRSYAITVSPSTRDVKTYTGYLDTVVSERNLPNNTAAYGEFVNALKRANMTSGTQLEGDKNDVAGICATGRLYEFSILKSDRSIETLWTSTCSGSPGSFKANVGQVSQLFLNQIPDAPNLNRTFGL